MAASSSITTDVAFAGRILLRQGSDEVDVGGQVAPGYSKADPWWIGGTNFLLNAFDRHVQTVAGALGEAEP